MNSRKSILHFAAMILLLAAGPFALSYAQQIGSETLGALRYRYIGPVGNRVSAVAGVPGQPNVYYAGAASGGIFKTTDGGINWQPIFDDQSVSSIGSLTVAPSDSSIVWAGTGEADIRSHISVGEGIFKSMDAGKTWTRMGLERTGRIGRVVVHPTNPEMDPANPRKLFAGMWQLDIKTWGRESGGPGSGLFVSNDGGTTWQRLKGR